MGIFDLPRKHIRVARSRRHQGERFFIAAGARTPACWDLDYFGESVSTIDRLSAPAFRFEHLS